MLLDVIAVTPQRDFSLLLEFANGEKRIFDMIPLLALKPWKKIASPLLFQKARIKYGTVVWPGEIDIAPETLYDDSKAVFGLGSGHV